jgi:hypothetical protein
MGAGKARNRGAELEAHLQQLQSELAAKVSKERSTSVAVLVGLGIALAASILMYDVAWHANAE